MINVFLWDSLERRRPRMKYRPTERTRYLFSYAYVSRLRTVRDTIVARGHVRQCVYLYYSNAKKTEKNKKNHVHKRRVENRVEKRLTKKKELYKKCL